jgi:beta-lactamase superfamily II metal-dependent hydrolase
MKFIVHVVIILCLTIEILSAQDLKKEISFETWQEGFFDIHHINTGNGNVCYMIFPDGTTMLIDAGIINKEVFEKKNYPLTTLDTYPNNSTTAAEWIKTYLEKLYVTQQIPSIDYVLITHFHSDHYGSIAELGKLIPFKKVIDRNYPNYLFPIDLKEFLKNDIIFQSYLKVSENPNIKFESLNVGKTGQISLQQRPQSFPQFSVRNVKAGATIWSGKSDKTVQLFSAKDMTDFYKGKYNENPLSIALKFTFGKFDYYTGGDNTGLKGFGLPKWYDVETPISKVVGKVEVATLNHHGNRDASNQSFVDYMNPDVVVQQTWCSDHPGQEVYERLIYASNSVEKRKVFATQIQEATKNTYGPWFTKGYQSMLGHVIIRVLNGGDKYYVYTSESRNNNHFVSAKYGPFISK